MKKKTSKYDLSERDQFTVVLEDLRSQFQVFGEALSAIDEKNERHFDDINDKFVSIEQQFRNVDMRFNQADKQFNRIDEKLEIFKTELALIRHQLVNPEEIRMLESRISILEKKMII